MMTCEAFRAACRDGVDTAETREHLRACTSCLDHAVAIDPDHLFRSLGGEELVPPGGVDAFVADVMQQVQVRTTERRIGGARRFPAIFRWGVAASLAIGLLSVALLDRPAGAPIAPAVAARPAAAPRELVVRPVVEEYQMVSATIVEVPTEPADDLKIVMIFDESLPVDL